MRIKATFFLPNGLIDHCYTFNMDDTTERVRFAIECKHAYRFKGARILTESL